MNDDKVNTVDMDTTNHPAGQEEGNYQYHNDIDRHPNSPQHPLNHTLPHQEVNPSSITQIRAISVQSNKDQEVNPSSIAQISAISVQTNKKIPTPLSRGRQPIRQCRPEKVKVNHATISKINFFQYEEEKLPSLVLRISLKSIRLAAQQHATDSLAETPLPCPNSSTELTNSSPKLTSCPTTTSNQWSKFFKIKNTQHSQQSSSVLPNSSQNSLITPLTFHQRKIKICTSNRSSNILNTRPLSSPSSINSFHISMGQDDSPSKMKATKPDQLQPFISSFYPCENPSSAATIGSNHRFIALDCSSDGSWFKDGKFRDTTRLPISTKSRVKLDHLKYSIEPSINLFSTRSLSNTTCQFSILPFPLITHIDQMEDPCNSNKIYHTIPSSDWIDLSSFEREEPFSSSTLLDQDSGKWRSSLPLLELLKAFHFSKDNLEPSSSHASKIAVSIASMDQIATLDHFKKDITTIYQSQLIVANQCANIQANTIHNINPKYRSSIQWQPSMTYPLNDKIHDAIDDQDETCSLHLDNIESKHYSMEFSKPTLCYQCPDILYNRKEIENLLKMIKVSNHSLSNKKSHHDSSPSSSSSSPYHLPWASRYVPLTTQQVCGSRNWSEFIRIWLEKWNDDTEHEPNGTHSAGDEISNKWTKLNAIQSTSRTNNSLQNKRSDHPMVTHKAMLVPGPTGVGKTASIYAVARQLGLQVLELNPSTKRSGAAIKRLIFEATQSRQMLRNAKPSPKSIISLSNGIILIEEVDIAFLPDDKGFFSSLVNLLVNTKCPVILTCNQIPLSLSLKLDALDIWIEWRMDPSPISAIYVHLALVSIAESCPVPTPKVLVPFIKYYKQDIRACLNNLQIWMPKKQILTPSSHSKDQLWPKKWEDLDVNNQSSQGQLQDDEAMYLLERSLGLSSHLDSRYGLWPCLVNKMVDLQSEEKTRYLYCQSHWTRREITSHPKESIENAVFQLDLSLLIQSTSSHILNWNLDLLHHNYLTLFGDPFIPRQLFSASLFNSRDQIHSSLQSELISRLCFQYGDKVTHQMAAIADCISSTNLDHLSIFSSSNQRPQVGPNGHHLDHQSSYHFDLNEQIRATYQAIQISHSLSLIRSYTSILRSEAGKESFNSIWWRAGDISHCLTTKDEVDGIMVYDQDSIVISPEQNANMAKEGNDGQVLDKNGIEWMTMQDFFVNMPVAISTPDVTNHQTTMDLTLPPHLLLTKQAKFEYVTGLKLINSLLQPLIYEGSNEHSK